MKVSQKKLAELMNVDVATVKWLLDSGAPRASSGKIDVYEFSAWLILQTSGS